MSLPDIPDLTPEEEARFDQLFKTLDVNNDGKIDVDDLSEALKTLQVAPPSGFSSREHAEVSVFLRRLQSVCGIASWICMNDVYLLPAKVTLIVGD